MLLHSEKRQGVWGGGSERGSLLLELATPWHASAPLVPVQEHPSQPMAHVIYPA